MDHFARLGYDTWCVDMEGYGRSDKHRDINSDIATGADDLAAATDYIAGHARRESLFLYGISSGALRAALFAQRHPERVRRGSPSTRSCGPGRGARRWPSAGSASQSSRRRTAGRSTVPSSAVIFTRDHPGTADDDVVDAFADAILALDDSVPTGTYVDMCANLPLVDPERIPVPTIIMRGQYDGIAGFDDLLDFFRRLPNPDKQFAVMPGIAHASFQQKNYLIAYHILHAFFSQPEPVYRG